jgi:hypothetical protein
METWINNISKNLISKCEMVVDTNDILPQSTCYSSDFIELFEKLKNYDNIDNNKTNIINNDNNDNNKNNDNNEIKNKYVWIIKFKNNNDIYELENDLQSTFWIDNFHDILEELNLKCDSYVISSDLMTYELFFETSEQYYNLIKNELDDFEFLNFTGTSKLIT